MAVGSNRHGKDRAHRKRRASVWVLALWAMAAAAHAGAFAPGPGQGTIKYASDNGRYEIGLGGRIQFDGAWYENDDRGKDNIGGTELRRVRLAISGRLDDWRYVIDYDLSGDRPVGQAISLSRPWGPGRVTFGQIKPFFSLEYLTDDLWATMQERAWLSDTMAPGYRYGVQYIVSTPHWVHGANLYNQANTDSDRNDGHGAALRTVWLPLQQPGRLLHLGIDATHDRYGKSSEGRYPGVGASLRLAGHLSDQSRFNLVRLDNGREVEADKYVVEFAYSQGPLHLQSELGRARYRDAAQAARLRTGYLAAGWFITGESRGYDRSLARFARTDPASSAGAWELALRYDYARGEQEGRDIETTARTLGVNWYINKNLRATLDYIHGQAEDRAGRAVLDKTNAITCRLQLAF